MNPLIIEIHLNHYIHCVIIVHYVIHLTNIKLEGHTTIITFGLSLREMNNFTGYHGMIEDQLTWNKSRLDVRDILWKENLCYVGKHFRDQFV
jgi:hypothetical protein